MGINNRGGIVKTLSNLNFIHNKTILITLVGIFSFFSLQMKHTKVHVAMTDLIDKKLPSSKNYRFLKDEFKLKNQIFVLIKSNQSILTKNELQYFQDLTNEYQSIDYVNQTISPHRIAIPKTTATHLNYYRLIDNANFKKSFEIFISSPWQNILISNSSSDYGLEVHFEDAKETNKFGSFDPKAISNFLKRLRNDLKDYDFKTVGTSIFTFYAFKGVQHNFKLNLLFFLIIILVFKFLFKTWKSGILFITTIIWSGVILHGLMAYLNMPLEILSSGLLTMIVVASLEDYFFICHESQKGKNLSSTFKELISPSFLTSLTTILGFGSLYFSDIEIVQRFGVFAAIGAFIEWTATFFLLPSLIKTFNINSLTNIELKTSNFFIYKLFNKKVSFKFILPFFILFPISFLISNNLKVSDSPLSLFPKDHKIIEDFNYLKSSRDWESQASLIFPLEISKQEKEEILIQVNNIENIKQIESKEETEKFITNSGKEKYTKAILNDFNTSNLSERYQSHLLNERVIIYIKDSNYNVLIETKKKIESICMEKCQLIGEIIAYSEFMEQIPLGFIKSLGSSLLMVALVLLILSFIKKIKYPFFFVLSNLWGPSALIFLMWIFDLKINFLSCIFITMMVGLTGDNGIQFLWAHRPNSNKTSGIEYHQKCAIQMGILLSLSCLIFTLSYFNPPREFGPIMAIAFLLSLFGDISLSKYFFESDKK